MLKKVVILGPESTGKSTLSSQLAAHYQCLWCPEYAREYLLKHGMDYTYEDLLIIAKGQVALEEEYSRRQQRQAGTKTAAHRESGTGLVPVGNPGLLFIDTNMYVMKVWCEFVFGKCHSYILEQIAQRKYDLYLLCNVDLPWVKDELREYPDLDRRLALYNIYRQIMINQPVAWVEISGNYEQRLSRAIEAVETILFKKAG
jgi:NadR type nicotinamide-nucleotide adenylyltransferase